MRVMPSTDDGDRLWLADLWRREWGGEVMVTKGQVHQLADLEALIAWDDDATNASDVVAASSMLGVRVGAATFRLDGEGGCELMSLNAQREGRGVGSALLEAVEAAARRAGCYHLWLITTNDNLDALRFYQRRGYRLAALYPGAVDQARKAKPTIPLVGERGIPLHDEIELDKRL